MANEKVLPLEQIAAASTPTDSARIVIHDSAGSANYIDLATLKRLVRESMKVGVNMVKGSGLLDLNKPSGGKELQVTQKLAPGDVITLSADDVEVVSANGVANTLYVDLYTASGKWVAYIGFRTDNGKANFSYTVTVPSTHNSENELVLRVHSGPSNNDQNHIIVRGLSLVRGSVAPLRWAPAPEDWGGG